MPVDSIFEKVSAYALQNGFTDIDDKSMDSSGVFYISTLKQPKLYNIPLVSACVYIKYSDSLFAGDSFYKKSYSISYRIKLPNYKSLKKAYDQLVLKFSKICGSGQPFKRSTGWTGVFGGMKFYPASSSYPTFFIAYSLTNYGDAITITYLKTDQSCPKPHTTCDLSSKIIAEQGMFF